MRLELYHGPMQELLVDVTGRSAKAASDKLASRISTEINRAGRVRSGLMMRSPRARLASRAPMRITYTIGEEMPFYTRYQNDGTRGSVARPGGVLAFKPKGSSVTVFARRVRGVQPARFFEKALASMTLDDFSTG